MDTYKIVDDKTSTVIREIREDEHVSAYEIAYNLITDNGKKPNGWEDSEIFIEVYSDGKFSHWVAPDTICEEYLITREDVE